MSWFGDILGSITGGDILKTGAAIGGAFLGADANESAADARTSANDAALKAQLDFSREGRQEMRDASNRGLSAISAGTQKYADTTADMRTERPVMRSTYRGLTDQQQIGLSDLQRDDNARLAATGMRGAGRAGIASVLDRDARYMAGARAANDQDAMGAKRAARASADAATGNLAQIYAQEGGAKANIETGQGANIGNSLRADGSAAAQITANNGAIAGGADIGNAQIYQSALNSLGGIFANADAERTPLDRLKQSYGAPSIGEA